MVETVHMIDISSNESIASMGNFSRPEKNKISASFLKGGLL